MQWVEPNTILRSEFPVLYKIMVKQYYVFNVSNELEILLENFNIYVFNVSNQMHPGEPTALGGRRG